MKHLIFKSSFHEKLKFLIIPMMLLTLGVGQMWGWTATFRCVPALTFGSNWSSGNTCKVKFSADYGWGDADSELSPTGLMYESGGNLYEIYSVTRSDLPGDGVRNLHFERWEGSSWKQNAGQYNDWRNCSAWSGSMYYGSWGSYSYKTWDIPANTTIVWDAGNESWTTAQLYIFKDGYDKAYDFTRVGSTTQFTHKYTTKWAGYAGLIIRKNSAWNAQTTNIYTDVTSSTTGVTLFTYQGNKSGDKLNWQKTTDAKKATSGTKIYFDNTASNWNEIWLRYGTSWFVRSSASAASKVTGTDNLYVITIPNDAYYASYHLANNYGATNYSDIATNYNLSHKIALQSSNLASDITYIPTTGSGTGTAGNPKTWSYSTISGHTRTLTFGSHTNGNIIVTYTDENGDEQTVSSASASSVTVAQTCKVVITAVPNTGYAPSTLTLGGASITSGAQQIIRADATIAATFVAETTYNITVSHKHGTRSLHDADVVSVGVTTPSSISSRSIDGFSFSSWTNLTNVTNKSADLTTDPISIVSTAVGSMTCNYTPWTCSMDVNTTSGNTGYSSRVEMSYDATVKAYYKEFTTTAATQYFRFYINSKKYAPSSNTEVVISGTKVAAATDVTGYDSNMPSVYFNDGGIGSKIKVWFDYENKKAWVEEVKYTVTISAGANGTVSPTSVSVGNVVASGSITATASDHYHWASWDVPSGVTITSGSGTKSITIKATADGKIVTANFAGDQYTITYKDQGDKAFSGTHEDSPTAHPTSHTYGTATSLNSANKTGYDFGGWFTTSNCASGTDVTSIGATAKTAAFTLYAKWTAKEYSTTNNIKHSDGSNAGTYTATYDATSIALNTTPSKTGYNITNYYEENTFTTLIANTDLSLTSATTTYTSGGKWKYTSAPNLYVKWTAKQYNITLDKKEGTADGSAKVKYDATTLTNISAPTKSGYHVEGYYGETGRTNKVADASGNLQSGISGFTTGTKWTKDDNATLFTKWEANTYTISFDADDESRVGTATNVQSNVTVTFDAHDYSASTVAVPVLTGYTFGGYYTAQNGGGVQIVNASGAWQANKTNYTDGSKNWIKAANTTLYAKWTGKEYTVTFNARGGSGLTPTSKKVTMGSAYGALATVTPPAGYVFDGWYTSAGGGTKVTSATQVTTAVDHTLYAHYIQKAQVYFKNIYGWENVYVTFDATWDGTQGAGNKGRTYRTMTQIPGTDIWYHDIPDNYLSAWAWNIAFNNTFQNEYYAFTKGEAVFRHDFDKKATMFVPTSNTGTSKDGNYPKNGVQYRSTGYKDGTGSDPEYTSGYWRTYNNTYSGYTMTYQKSTEGDTWHGGHKMESAKVGDNVFCFTVNMEANSQYNFSFYKNYNVNWKSKQFCYNPITQINSSNCTNLQLDCNPNNSYMQTTVAGEYTFQLEMKADGHMYLSVIYPLAVGDFRVRYNYTKGSAKTYYSEIIKGRANGKDTISIFIHSKDSASSRSLTVEKCTGISSGTPTWNTSYLTVTSKLPAATTAGGKTSGVYDFIITQNGSKEIILDNFSYWKQYTGNYYIRTQCADGGWDFYRERSDNLMTLSEYSLTQTLSAPYSHYYCRFIESTSTDITYCIATDYSPNISGILVGDATIGGNSVKTLPASANVRFTWNEETNAMFRAYLKNAQNENERFLVLHGSDNKVLDASGNTIPAAGNLNANELLFTDLGNWIYQVNLQAQPGAKVSLIANYNNADRYLIGGASSFLTIIDGEGSAKYEMITVYDFKTNRLMTAWTPSGEVSANLTDVDVLLIRYKQDAGTAITLATGKTIGNQDHPVTVIGAIRFDYNDMVGHVANWTNSSRPLLKYFISFPFNVKVSDLFGLNSAYGDAYVIQKYAGDERAQKGFFRGDGTTTFWKDLKAGDVMKANEGYCVILDNDYFNGDVGDVWQYKSAGSSVYLYFPSAETVGEIATTSKTVTVPERTCTIDRSFTSGGRSVNHQNTDSHWNMMGVPIFNTHSDNGTAGQPGAVFADSGQDGDGHFNYYYQWGVDNSFTIHTAKNEQFKSMHGYMVQYHGDVTFKTAAAPASVAARKAPMEDNYQLELQVRDNNDEILNRAYVELRENACDTFALNEDVYMSFNNRAVNVYTLAGSYDVAANVLSVGNHTIPVCVEVTKAGQYTFSMPSNFSGEVTLVDLFNNERINLSTDDYEVDLTKGVTEDRFLLELNINKVVTSIDGINGEGTLKDGKAHKFLQNGILYILQNGVLYDARGARVQ